MLGSFAVEITNRSGGVVEVRPRRDVWFLFRHEPPPGRCYLDHPPIEGTPPGVLPGRHPLAEEFEEQFCGLVKEYKGEGVYLSVHDPDDDPNAKDDAYDATALALLAAAEGGIGELTIM